MGGGCQERGGDDLRTGGMGFFKIMFFDILEKLRFKVRYQLLLPVLHRNTVDHQCRSIFSLKIVLCIPA